MSKTEQPTIYVHRRGNVLAPEMELDAELIQRFHPGDRIKVTLHTGRSPSKLRFWWAFLHQVVSSTECSPTAEALHETVKLMCGYTTPVMVKGMTVMVPRSISFSSMTEQEFSKFLDDGIRFIASTYGVTPKQAGEAA